MPFKKCQIFSYQIDKRGPHEVMNEMIAQKYFERCYDTHNHPRWTLDERLDKLNFKKLLAVLMDFFAELGKHTIRLSLTKTKLCLEILIFYIIPHFLLSANYVKHGRRLKFIKLKLE